MKKTSELREKAYAMKTITSSVALCFALAPAWLAPSHAQAADIYYVGTLTDSTETVNWLKSATPKTYGINGNKYGSYAAIDWLEPDGGTYSAGSISWAGSGPQFRQAEYAKINSVADAARGNSGPGALVNDSPTNTYCGIALGFSAFRVNEDLSGKVLRVGVIADVLGAGEVAAQKYNGLFLRQRIGGNATSILVPLPTPNSKPDMVFFDIVGAQVGDEFVVEDKKNVGGTDATTTLTGPVAWDTNTIAAVLNAPTILAQTPSDTCMAGATFLIEAVAGGAPRPTYQWLKNNAMLPGATDQVYTIASASQADAASYSVVATTPAGSVTSSPVSLTVVSTNIPAGLSSYRAAVMAEPSLISYYSFDNGLQDSAGMNAGAFAGTPAVGYRLAPGSGGGLDKAADFAADGQANLGVVPDFAFPTGNGTIEAWVKCNPNWQYDPLYAPCIVSCRSVDGVVYSFHMDGIGKNAIGLWNGTSYQTIPIPAAGAAWHHLGIIISNAGTWTLVWDGAVQGTLAQPLGTPGVTPPTQLGNSSPAYWQARENWIGSIDEVAFYRDSLSPAQVQFHYNAKFASPAISKQPRGNFLLAGTPCQMNVAADGLSLHYQWFKNDQVLPGATSDTITFASLVLGDAGAYFCVVTNTFGAATSSVAVLQVAAAVTPAVSNYWSAVKATTGLISLYTFSDLTARDSFGSNDGALQGATQFTPGFGGGPDQALVVAGNGWVNLGTVPAFNFFDLNTFVGAGTVELWWRADWTTSPGYDPCLFANRNDSAGGVNYSIHVGANKNFINFWNGNSPSFIPVANVGTNWHHSLVIFDNGTWTFTMDGQVVGTANQLNTGNPLTCQIGSSGPGGQEVWRGGLASVAYYSTVLTPADAAGHYGAYVNYLPATITRQPQGGDYLAGNALTLSVGALGGNLQYQWFKNGAPVGGNSPALSFQNATAANSGNYAVVLTNEISSVTSAVAAVTVRPPAPQLYQDAVLATPGLISFYPFDGQNANDLVGHNNGTFITSSAFTAGLGGGANLALSLDGFNGAVTFGSVPAFDFTPSEGQGAIEIWLRADWTANPGYDPAIVADENTSKYYEVRLSAAKNAIKLSATANPSYAIPDAGTNWHHLVVVMNSPFADVYWDGQKVNSQPVYLQIQGAGQSVQLGAILPSSTAVWQGALDNCAFYSTALSGAEIAGHYRAMLGLAAAPVSLTIAPSGGNLVISWPAAPASGLVLQERVSLSSGDWAASAAPVTIENGVNQVVVAPSGGGMFYRLGPQ